MTDNVPELSEARALARAAPRPMSADELLTRVVALCKERRGGHIVSLDMRGHVDYMDHLVIVTGRSSRQNKSIAKHIIASLKRDPDTIPLSRSGMDSGGWICLDYLDVIVHIFDDETRAHYDLELRWAEAERTEHESAAPAPEEDPLYNDEDDLILPE